MSLADACLMRLFELHSDCQAFTLDADFRRYRRMGGRSFRCWRPGEKCHVMRWPLLRVE
jgi:hypothetical protein